MFSNPTIRYYVLIVLILSASYTFAQAPYWTMALQAGGWQSSHGEKVATDDLGNIYVLGYFSDTLVLGTYTLASITFSSSTFLAKYNSSGVLLWALSPIGFIESYSMVVDFTGNIFISGSFTSSNAIFGSDTLLNADTTAYHHRDMFITKYDTHGNAIWAKRAGGKGNDSGGEIIIDNNGHLYLAGAFSNSSSTGNDTLILGNDTLTCTGVNSFSSFIAKYDTSGNALWGRSTSNQGNGGFHIYFDSYSNTLYLGGKFRSDSLAFGNTTVYNHGYNTDDIYMAEMDTSGNILWARSFGGDNHEGCSDILKDNDGNILITGSYYNDSLVLGSNTLYNSGPVNTSDIYFAKFDSIGTPIWAKKAGGLGFEGALEIVEDAGGFVYLMGSFGSPSITFDLHTLTNPSGTVNNLFVVKFNSSGNALWAKGTGGQGGLRPYCMHLAQNSGIALFVTGNINFQPGSSGSNVTFNNDTLFTNGYLYFLAKLEETILGDVSATGSKSTFTLVYPNPSSSIFNFKTIDNINELQKIEVYNLTGELIMNSTDNQIDLSLFSNNLYFYRLFTKSGKFFYGRIVKN
jgi:hypothetical protein